MKKRAFLSGFLALALMMSLVPAQAAELPAPEGLSITWYTDYEGLMRRYGTERMLLVKGGKSGLFGLDGTKYTDCIFDAFGEFNGSGLAPACLGGKWGMVDLDGRTVVDFQYATQEEAAAPIAHFVSQWSDGSAPYALADASGKALTEYKYWHYRDFSWGLAAVTDGLSWGYVDEWGREVVPCQYGEVSAFQPNGRARVYRYEGRISNFIDAAGREMLVAPSVYTSLWDAGQGLWGLGVKGGAEFYNDQGELVLQVQCKFTSDPKGQMQGNVFDETGTASFYSEDGTWRTVTIPVGEDGLHEGLYRVQAPDSGLWGFENVKKEPIVPAVFDAVGYFDHGVAVVKSGNAFGLLKNPLGEADEAHKVSDWAAEEIAAATEAGYVTPSCGTYQTFTITRAQFAELAVNYVEKKTGKTIEAAPLDTFTDADDETIRKAYAAGIVQGMGDGTFGPGRPLTREQLATMLWRAMEKTGLKVGRPADLTAYTDGAQVSSWAADSLAALVGLEVMAGTGAATLSPKDSCTVEQAILLVYRAAETSKTAWGTEYQDTLAQTTIKGLLIGTPFEKLSPELLSVLKPEGEPYDAGVFNPGEEIGQRYVAPGIEVITSTATEKVLKRVLEGQDKDYLLKHYGSEDWQEVYDREKGREYVDTVILSGDNYHMVSGLKVGDSGERVRELGYQLGGETYGTYGMFGSATVYMGNDVVTQIEVCDCIGRRIGPFFDP